MAQNIGDTLGMLTLYEAYCGACVSEVMKPYLRRTARLQQGFEAPVEQIAWIDCRALLRSEHQLVPSICHTMSCEGFYGGSRELYAPTLIVLGLLLNPAYARYQHRAPNLERIGVEIQICPLQP